MEATPRDDAPATSHGRFAAQHRDASAAHARADAIGRAVRSDAQRARPPHLDALDDLVARALVAAEREEQRAERRGRAPCRRILDRPGEWREHARANAR